ncbi:UvrB/UvrC motif-containing protein [bacterium]|nr:UvrB/UvrC motif-containing protein [bacterium]
MQHQMCQCGKKPATIHITEIIDGEKQELHLCEECAQQKQILFHNVPDLGQALAGLFHSHDAGENDQLQHLLCPACGITYADFRAGGRFGCPNDYELFREAVDPLLQRFHGATEHCGKTPAPGQDHSPGEHLADLSLKLQKAVADEAYELAAQLRDEIYELKKEEADATE